MKRGEVWTVSGGSRCTGKPRPAVVVQEDRFAETESLTVCGFTTDAPLIRLKIEPIARNGLKSTCRIMVDKFTTVSKARLGKTLRRLDNEDLLRLNRALVVSLGLADSPGRR